MGSDVYDMANEYYSGKTIYDDGSSFIKDTIGIEKMLKADDISKWLRSN